MANHRMFSNRIANSSRFLQMPTESQLLYFHMCLRADDDGVVEAYPLMKLLGTQPDSYKVLGAKGFIKQLNEDQVIVVLDWLEHNKIRADRKVNSIYKHLLPKEIEIIQPKPRSDVQDNSYRLGGPSTVSVSKVKLSKVSNNNPPDKPEEIKVFVLEEKLTDMESNPNSYLDHISSFIRCKDLKIENSKQLSAVIARYSRTAKQLEGWETEKVWSAMEELQTKYNHEKKIKGDLNAIDWGMETILKKLTK